MEKIAGIGNLLRVCNNSDMSKDRLQELFRELHRIFRVIQKKNRFVSRDVGDVFSIQQSTMMLEIDTRAQTTAVELANLMDLDKSTVSRHLSALEGGGWVASHPSPHNSRLRIISISEKGSKFLAEYDRVYNEIFRNYLIGLSKADEKEVASFFAALADGLGVRKGPVRPIDHPIRCGMRRLTHGFGILKSSFMGSDLNVFQWQVLGELYWNDNVETAIELSEILSSPQTSISSVLQSLKEKGYIEIRTSLTDRRRKQLKLTASGRNVVEKIEIEAARRMQQALPVHSLSSLERSLSAGRRFTGEDTSLKRQQLSKQEYVQPLLSEVVRARARKFIVNEALVRHAVEELPEILVGYDSMSFGLFDAKGLCAVIELREDRPKSLVLWNFVSAKNLAQRLQRSFFLKTLESVMQQNEISEVLLPERSAVWSFLEAKNLKKEDRGYIISRSLLLAIAH